MFAAEGGYVEGSRIVPRPIAERIRGKVYRLPGANDHRGQLPFVSSSGPGGDNQPAEGERSPIYSRDCG